MLQYVRDGKITLEQVVDKMSHAPAKCFKIAGKGYIREGYDADLVLVDLKAPYTVSKENILYKCGWSPFEGHTFPSSVVTTFVNGNKVYHNGKVVTDVKGHRLRFDRN